MKKKLLTFSAIVLLGTAGLLVKAQSSWSITGNSNIIGSGANFIGTRNSQPLIFKTNNVERMRLTKNGKLGIGTTSPVAPLEVVNSYNVAEDRLGFLCSAFGAGGNYGYGLWAEGGWYGAY